MEVRLTGMEDKDVIIMTNKTGQEIRCSGRKLTEFFQNIAEQDSKTETNQMKKIVKPTEEKGFKVNLKEIMASTLFDQERKNKVEEETRGWILSSIAEAKANPEKYRISFVTFRPKMSVEWEWKTAKEIHEAVENKKDDQNFQYVGDDVEKGLELAQRLVNGETWKEVCQDPDTAEWRQLVYWRNRTWRIVGGATQSQNERAAAEVESGRCLSNREIPDDVIPFIVIRKKLPKQKAKDNVKPAMEKSIPVKLLVNGN